MKIVYCYIQFMDENGKPRFFHGLDKIELNLSDTDRFCFDPQLNSLQRKERETPLPTNFWANGTIKPNQNNIYNINVIAGENGSGKTTAIRCLMRVLAFFYAATVATKGTAVWEETYDKIYDRVILLLYDNDVFHMLHYFPNAKNKALSIDTKGFYENQIQKYLCHNWKELNLGGNRKKYSALTTLLRKTKVIYMTNTLSQYDYERHLKEEDEKRLRDLFIYNVSVGSTIGLHGDRFFLYETYKQVKYVFDKDQIMKRQDIPEIRTPRVLRMRLRQDIVPSQEKSPETDTGDIIAKYLGKMGAYAFYMDLIIRLKSNSNIITLFDSIVYTSDKNTMKKRLISAYALFELIIAKVRNWYYFRAPINCVTVLPNDSIITGSQDGIIRMWNNNLSKCLLVTNEFLRKAVKYEILCIAAISNEQVVCGISNGKLQIWDINKGFCIKNLPKNADVIIKIAVLPNRRDVITCSYDGTISIWDCSAGKCQSVLATKTGRTTCMAVSPNGQSVCVVQGKRIRVYSIEQGICLADESGRDGLITCATYISDDFIMYGIDNGRIRVVNIDMDNGIYLPGITSRVRDIIAISNRKIVVSYADHNIGIWEWTGEQELLGWKCTGRHELNEDIKFEAVLSDGKVLCRTEKSSLQIWDFIGGFCVRRVPDYDIKGNDISGFLYNAQDPNNTILGKTQEQYDIMLQDEKKQMERYFEYLDYVFERSHFLFSQFTQIDENTFELSLDDIKKKDVMYNNMIEFIQLYRSICEPINAIEFDWGLSSGEENMLRIFSNLYHIFDKDYSSGMNGEYKIYNNDNPSGGKREKTECDTVLMFMDEADLTLHPEWQRRLIAILTTYVPQIFPISCIKDIQLVLTTHSPLLLGDIPNENIIYFFNRTENENTSCHTVNEETFGQNIHNILKENFFLKNGTVGAFATRKINKMAERLAEIKATADKIEINVQIDMEMREIRKLIDLVAPGVLHNRLEELYAETLSALNERWGKKEIDKTSPKGRKEELLDELLKLSPDEGKYVVEQYRKEQEMK